MPLHRRGSGFVLRVDYARWGQTPEDLRHLALSAPHARTRERALALFDITQHRCATQVAGRTGRRAHTVMDWVHAYNAQGPDALTFRRTGGRRPLFAPSAKPNSARRSAQPSARRPPHPQKGPTPRRAGRCAAWSAGCASASAWCAVARRSGLFCTAASCRGRKPKSCWDGPIQSSDKRSSSSSRACWRAPNATSIWWSFSTRRTSTRTRISATAGPSVASGYGSPQARRVSPRGSRSMGCISTTRARCGCGLSRAPTATTRSRCCAGLRAAFPDEALIVLWDGAPYHRAQAVREAATALNITLMPLPGYSPDLMPVEELWRWLREDVTDHHCHASADDLTRRAGDFEARLNQDPFVIADRLWVKDCLDPEEEKLPFSK